jgi:hypothetical protein
MISLTCVHHLPYASLVHVRIDHKIMPNVVYYGIDNKKAIIALL